MAILTIPPCSFQIETQAPIEGFVGPIVPGHFKVWQGLVDYQHWHQWMEGAEQVKLVESGDDSFSQLGRGSTFRLRGPTGHRTLEILLWAPSQRLVYLIGTSTGRYACSFEVNLDRQTTTVSVVVGGEIEVLGVRRLVSTLIAYRYQRVFARQCQRLANQLSKHLL